MPRKLIQGPERRTHPLVWCIAILCTVVAIAVIIVGLVVFVGYLVIHPSVPVISVVTAHLDKLQNDLAGLFETQLTIYVKAENDNAKAHASFSDTSFVLSFEGIAIARLVADPFDVAKNGSVEFPYRVESSSIPLNPEEMLQVDLAGLRTQIETYCEFGLQPWSPNKLPYPSDVPDSALIIRKHGLKSNLFSCLMFNELEGFNPRDQLAFAFVRDQMRPKLEMNMFEVEVFEQIAVEYRHNIIKYHTSHHHDHDNSTILGGSQSHHSHTKSSKIINHSLDLINYGSNKCQKYLSKMWDESR